VPVDASIDDPGGPGDASGELAGLSAHPELLALLRTALVEPIVAQLDEQQQQLVARLELIADLRQALGGYEESQRLGLAERDELRAQLVEVRQIAEIYRVELALAQARLAQAESRRWWHDLLRRLAVLR
jgi:hypothetical protein